MILEGKIGPRYGADGAEGPFRLDKSFAQVVAQAGGKYGEAVARGIVFSASTNATSGVAPGTAIGTTAAFTLANPAGSKVNLMVLRTTMAFVSGTLGAGSIQYIASANPVGTAVSGTALVAQPCLIGSRAGASGLAFTTATIPAGPLQLRPFATTMAMIAAGAHPPFTVTDDVDGEFIITPGCALSLEGQGGAGGTPLLCFGMTWLEYGNGS